MKRVILMKYERPKIFRLDGFGVASGIGCAPTGAGFGMTCIPTGAGLSTPVPSCSPTGTSVTYFCGVGSGK
jgi:hypothetical protein